MKSKEILPLNKRLDRMQLLELQGFKATSAYSLISNKGDLLLTYHKALIAAEKEIEEFEKQFGVQWKKTKQQELDLHD